MKTMWIICLILGCCLLAFANGSSLNDPTKFKAPAVEIAELEALIAQAKVTGQTPDPAWTTRIRELVPLVKGHPGDVVYDLQANESNGGFAPGAVIYPQELTPLEQQIKELEFQIDGGFSASEPDPVTIANLKDQLRTLYAQRAVRRPYDPMDEGNDACPALTIPFLPYVDQGETNDEADNFDPLVPCNPSDAPDVIYSYTANFTGSHTIAIDSANYDTYLHVRTTGACPGTVQVACDDDGGPGLLSLINMNMTYGTTYFIIVDGFTSDSGFYRIRINDNCDLTCQAGDVMECAEAIVPTHSIDDCNGACNNQNLIPTWQDIFPCQTVCGRAFTYLNHEGSNWRDTDVYRFTLTEACSLRLTLNSEFPTQLLVMADGCPWSTFPFIQNLSQTCTTVAFITQCFPAGAYNLWVGPSVFTGIPNSREYRLRLDLIPCNGCRIDASITAPGSGAWHTCVAGNDCAQRPSQDYNFCVNIPYESDWTFSTCNDDSIWDSYIYLNSTCCGGIIAQDDDACGGVGLSVINCVHLQRGTYYLNVEGFSSAGCGPFVLNVSECVGSCCYGNPASPICSFINNYDCDSLSGLFTYQEPCSTGACFTRPQCGVNAQFSQQPYLPDEAWNGFPSDNDFGELQTDNYVVDGPIGSIRFWGFPVSCSGSLERFQIIFSDGSDDCFYSISATGAVLPPLYSGFFNLSEYFVQLPLPCTILSGNLSIAQFGNSNCEWYWSTTPFGDGIFPGDTPADFAFCLGGTCQKIDSLTILWQPGDQRKLDWWMPQAGFVRVYSTTNASDIYPAGYVVIASGSVPNGHFTYTDFLEPEPLRIYVVTVECNNGAIVEPDVNSPFRRIE